MLIYYFEISVLQNCIKYIFVKNNNCLVVITVNPVCHLCYKTKNSFSKNSKVKSNSR